MVECVVPSGLGGFLWLWTLPEHDSYTVFPGNLCSWRGKLVVLSVLELLGGLNYSVLRQLCVGTAENRSLSLAWCSVTIAAWWESQFLMWFYFHSRLCPNVCVCDPDLFLVLMDLKVTEGYSRRLDTPTAGFKHSCAVMSPWGGG